MKRFTPYINSKTRVRIEMLLNDADYAKIGRGRGWSAVVTDQTDGQVYAVKAANCGSDACYCAAVIVKNLTESRSKRPSVSH